MTEIKRYNENESQNQENFSNNLSIKDLKSEIINSLKDEKITPDEAKNLKELFGEINNINKEARKAWSGLSLEIRKNFQKKLGAVEDGKIGKETLTKLENIANIQINLENPETQKLSENLGKNVSKTRNSLKEIGIPLDNNLPQKITAEADSNGNLNIYNETTKVPKTITVSPNQIGEGLENFSSLSKTQTKNIEQEINNDLGKFKVLGYNVKSIQFSTENDNIGKIAYGDDQGKSFGFSSKVILEKNGNPYMVKGEISAYTDGSISGFNGKNKYFENSGNNFLDVSNIQVLKGIENYENKRGDKIDIFIGGGLQARGMAPGLMKKIQNTWHKSMDFYENTSEYTGEKGISPTVSVELSGKKYLAGDKEGGVYVGGNLSSNMALDKKGISDLSTEAFIGTNYKKVDLQAGMGYSKTYGGQSEVLNFANGQNTYIFGKMDIGITKTSSVFVDLKVDPKTRNVWNDSKNDRSQVSIGFQKKF